MRSRAPSIVLVLALCALAGCRSDGGFDRQDSAHGFRFACSRIAAQTAEDASRTAATITGVPAAIGRSFADGFEAMSISYHLYLEAHEPSRPLSR